jgi:hypothetical protein
MMFSFSVMQICICSEVHKTLSDSLKSNKDQNKDVKKLTHF